jgi:hypothetical protein
MGCGAPSTTGPANCNAGYWGDSRLEANSEILVRVKAELSNQQMWTNASMGQPQAFEGPDFSQGDGIYEAEYAEADTWLDCCGLGGLPQVNDVASNGREVMIMNFGAGGNATYGIDFERVRRGTQLTVTLNSLGPECCGGPGNPSNATFGVYVNGEAVSDPILVPSGGFENFTFDVDIKNKSTVRVEINPNNGGNLIWVDKIEVAR